VTGIGQLKAGVVGTGFIGVVHVDALRRLGIEVSGVVGSTPERAAAKRIAPAYESYEALLDDERVDVVHITTPNYLRHPQVKLALASWKHVVCEKPLVVASAPPNVSTSPVGRLRTGMAVERSAKSSTMREPVTNCVRSIQCDPMSPTARSSPPFSGSSRQFQSVD
jgi:predicted dinucleotide-binding enzyme